MNKKLYYFKKMWPLVTLVFATILLVGFYYWCEDVYKGKILLGVQAGAISLGGLDEMAAMEVLKEHLYNKNLKITIISLSSKYIYSASDFGVAWSLENIVNQAMTHGRTGWWGHKITERLWTLTNYSNFPLQYSLDNNKFTNFLETLKKKINQVGKNSSINIDKENQSIIVIPAISGRELETILLEATLKKHWQFQNGGNINAPIISTDPQLTTQMIQTVADKVTSNISKEHSLEVDSQKKIIQQEEIWDWLEIVQQSNGYLVRFNPQKVNLFLSKLKTEVDQSMIPAQFEILADKVKKFQIHQKGISLNVFQTAEVLQQSLLSGNHELVANVEYTKPTTELKDLNNFGIHELVARGESNFSGSPKNRRHNIKVGASKFDLVLIKPQEKFSFNLILGKVDDTTGYLPELVIKGDETTPEFGGGLCQISTTTFRAVLNGGYPIVARRNHSYRVSYYEPAGTDATVYLPYPDFRFTNDTDFHILIDTWVDEKNNSLYFDFYSHPLDRRVELEEPRIYNITEPPEPIYIETSELPEGEIKKIDNAHRGADAILYRYIYNLDGRKIRTDKFKSHYIPWPDKYLVGVVSAPKLEADLENVLPEDLILIE